MLDYTHVCFFLISPPPDCIQNELLMAGDSGDSCVRAVTKRRGLWVENMQFYLVVTPIKSQFIRLFFAASVPASDGMKSGDSRDIYASMRRTHSVSGFLSTCVCV